MLLFVLQPIYSPHEPASDVTPTPAIDQSVDTTPLPPTEIDDPSESLASRDVTEAPVTTEAELEDSDDSYNNKDTTPLNP